MSLDTFSGLKSSIADHLDRDDLTSQIPDFITLAETRHKRDVRIKEMITRAAITIDARQESLPTGFLEAISFRLLTTPVTNLLYVPYYEMNRLRQESSGKPKYFTVGSEFEFDVSPDSSYSGEIVYFKSVTPLSDAAPSNDILTVAPDVYLYAALTAATPFLMDDPRITVWNSLYQNAVNGLNDLLKKTRSGGPLISRVAGATP